MDWNPVIVIALKILAVIALVLLNGFFVATEFALVKVRQTQLEPMAGRNHKRAGMALQLTRHLDAYLSACQLGITLASLGLGWIGEPIFADLLQPIFNTFGLAGEAHETLRHSISFGVGFSIITFLHIVVGEMAPKSLAIRLPTETSLWVSFPMRWFYVAMYPFIWLLNESSLLLLRWIGLEPAGEGHGVHSEEELRLVITSAQRESGASRRSRDLVLNALSLRHRIVREVMRPRREITPLDTHATLEDCIATAEVTRYSRFPLCEDGDLDRTLGVIHIKDLYALRGRAASGADLAPALRKLIFVPETARLEKLLDLFLSRKLHLAIVVDEYGSTVGMATLENILEEIVGQIQDEFDAEKPQLVQVNENEWELTGTVPLHQLESIVGTPFAEKSVSTVSGLVMRRLGGFPKPGDCLSLGPAELRVEEMDGLLISKLRLKRMPGA
jgi:CBS domain containing-hemolysin-like protein